MGVLGCDLSNHQGIVNWRRLKADGIKFAWVKATEGRSYVDTQLARNLREARRVRVPVGVYHYARPDNNRSDEEAAHFLRVIGRPRDGDLIPVLDFEQGNTGLKPLALCQWAERWLRAVGEALNVKPILYSYPYYLTGTMGGATARLRRYPLWLADYGPNDGKKHPLSPAGRRASQGFKVVAHQYTSNGKAGGFRRLDMNDAPALVPLIYTANVPLGDAPLPGPSPKPKWFWDAAKEFLRRRGER